MTKYILEGQEKDSKNPVFMDDLDLQQLCNCLDKNEANQWLAPNSIQVYVQRHQDIIMIRAKYTAPNGQSLYRDYKWKTLSEVNALAPKYAKSKGYTFISATKLY